MSFCLPNLLCHFCDFVSSVVPPSFVASIHLLSCYHDSAAPLSNADTLVTKSQQALVLPFRRVTHVHLKNQGFYH